MSLETTRISNSMPSSSCPTWGDLPGAGTSLLCDRRSLIGHVRERTRQRGGMTHRRVHKRGHAHELLGVTSDASRGMSGGDRRGCARLRSCESVRGTSKGVGTSGIMVC